MDNKCLNMRTYIAKESVYWYKLVELMNIMQKEEHFVMTINIQKLHNLYMKEYQLLIA